MNKSEARQLMMKYLIPRIEKYGFKERGRGTEFEVIRKTKNGEDSIGGGFTDYNPIQQIVYGTGKSDKRILDILFSVQSKGIQLSPPVNKKTVTTTVFSKGKMPLMETEADVEKCVGIMLDFLEGTAFPTLDRFEDIREIDKIINGPEPWETDWQMPYSFGAFFNFTRLIIAKLSGNNKYDALIDFTYDTLERRSKENGQNFVYDRNDLTKPLPALIQHLSTLKPLY